jgi:1-acyl-sn-glycerol-3-phosphate acyltransferase
VKQRWKQEAGLGNPGQLDPRAVRRWRRYASPLVRLAFRPRLDGIENLPATGPYMIVANHSGMGLAEIMAIIACWLRAFVTARPIAAMVHPLTFNSFPAGGWVKRLGAIPSTKPAAEAALAAGVPVLVFPGGDHEAMRPIWQAGEVQFAGRKGFLSIARAAGVPIVPMGIRGSHFTAPILWRSDRWLARLLVLPYLLGMKRHPLTLLGVLGVALLFALGPIVSWWLTVPLAWLWLVIPLSQVPWIPWRIRMRIGAPIAPATLFPDDTDATLFAAYRRVEAAVQSLVTLPSDAARARADSHVRGAAGS